MEFVSPGMHVMLLAERADEVGLASLTARQQVVVLAMSAHGHFVREGVRFLLESDWPMQPVADAFREVGLTTIARRLDRVVAQVAARPEPTDEARREALLAASRPTAFRKAEAAIRAVDARRLDERLTAYMDRHPLDFPEIQLTELAPGEPL